MKVRQSILAYKIQLKKDYLWDNLSHEWKWGGQRQWERDENESEANYFSLKGTTIKGLTLGQPIMCMEVRWLAAKSERERESWFRKKNKQTNKQTKTTTYIKYKNVKKKYGSLIMSQNGSKWLK